MSFMDLFSPALGVADMIQKFGSGRRMQKIQKQAWARDDNAVRRRMKDLKAAGLSPSLAAGSAAASSAPIAATQGEQIRSTAFSDKSQLAMNMMTQRADIARTSAETRRINTQAQSDEIDRQLKEIDLRKAQERETLENQYFEGEANAFDPTVGAFRGVRAGEPTMRQAEWSREYDRRTLQLSMDELDLRARELGIPQREIDSKRAEIIQVEGREREIPDLERRALAAAVKSAESQAWIDAQNQSFYDKLPEVVPPFAVDFGMKMLESLLGIVGNRFIGTKLIRGGTSSSTPKHEGYFGKPKYKY